MSSRTVLEGRADECEAIGALLAGLPGGGAGLLLSGDPGIGKSALLDFAARAAGRAGYRVLRVCGVESEAVLPYSALGELVLPLRERLAQLLGPQRQALERALALAEGDPPEPYAVCSALLALLTAESEQQPLVVLVDDLHWADQSSRQAVEFTARRLAGTQILVLLASRTAGWAALPERAVCGIDDEAAARVLAAEGLDPAGPEARGLIRLGGGNPLVLVEYAAALLRRSAQPLSGPLDPDHVPAPGPLVARTWQSLIRDLPEPTRQALVFAAAGPDADPATLAAALGSQDLRLADLEPAEQRGLLQPGPGGGYRLRHPVLRPVLLNLCSRSRLLTVYQALARYAGADTRAWYRAAAALGPDEEVAAELAQQAQHSRRRGASAAAAQAWHRAAELSPEPPIAAARLLNAALDALHAGAPHDAVHRCEQALRLASDPLLVADIELLRGQARTLLGEHGSAHRALSAAAAAVRPADPARACALYGAATLPAAMAGQVALACELASSAVELTDPGDGSGSRSRVLLGAARTLRGEVAEARELLLGALGDLPGPDSAENTTDVQQLLVQAAQGLSWLDEERQALTLLDRVVDRVRRSGALGLLPYALAVRAATESRTAWLAARADAVEAADWAKELGQRAIAGYAHIVLATLAARAGDAPGCREQLDRYKATGGATPGVDMLATGAHGSAELFAGDLTGGRRLLEQAYTLARRAAIGNPNMLTFTADLVEARHRDGDPEGARRLTDRLAEQAATTGLVWPEAAAARCRALLATDLDEALDALAHAEPVHARRDMPYERARALLLRGQVLRRRRRTAAAREPLAEARRIFETLGAPGWAELARRELDATGGGPSRPAGDRPGGLHLLSAQELQVARAVGAGLSNPEAAATLFLSRKTVEAHLTSTYRKLGIRSRADLARVLARAGLV